MTDQAEPGGQPAHDLAAFDVSKRSPEQIAQAFARWKEQRKRQGPVRAGRPAHPRPLPAIARGAAQDSPPDPEPKPRAIQYSAPFAALLAAGSEPTVPHRIWYPDIRLPGLRRPRPTRRRPKATWVLTGAASIVAVMAMASGALLEQSRWRAPAEAGPSAAHVLPLDIPFIAAPPAARAAEWKLQRTIDLALMKAAPIAEATQPPVPVVRAASKAAAAQPLSEPKFDIAAPGALQFVPKPFVPSGASATATRPAVPAAATALGGDPRPDALVQRGHDKSKNALGANNRIGASGSKPGVAGSGGSADPRSASSRGGRPATDGASDPASGATGGDGEGDGDGGGSGTGGDTGGGDTGSGDTGGGSGSDTGGDTGGGDSGGGAAGGESGGDTGGGEAGGSDTDDDSSGDAGDDDSSGGDSASGDGSGENGSAGGGSEDKNKDKSD